MPRVTVDVEKLLIGLYQAQLPDVTVAAAADVDYVTTLPLLIVSPIRGAMVSNGYPSGGWRWIFGVTILANGHGTASDLADSVYQITHGFDSNAVLAGVGEVGTVEDDEMPRRTGKTDVNAQNITQFTGSFTAVIKPV